MKFLAVLQIVCILFLSSWSGVAKPVAPAVKFDCCKKNDKGNHCAQHESKQKDNCDSQGCNMLLTCGICGFLAIEPVSVKPATFIILENPVALYKTGNASGYVAMNWKPPKV